MAKEKQPDTLPTPPPAPEVLESAGPDIEREGPPPLASDAPAAEREPDVGPDEQLWKLEYNGNSALIKVKCQPGHEKSNQPEIEARQQFNATLRESPPGPRYVRATCIKKGSGIASAVLDRRAILLERAKRRGEMPTTPEQEIAVLEARIRELKVRKSA